MKKWVFEEQEPGLRLSFEVKNVLGTSKSKYQSIMVVQTATHGRLLLLDGKVMLTERDEFIYHEMITHVPLLSHGKPTDVLIVGGGDGGTLRECAKHDLLENIDLCEIDKMVITMSKRYLPFVAIGFDDPRVKAYVADGFEYVRRPENQQAYDVVILDSADPVGPAENLFGRKFFEMSKSCLKKGGVLCGQCESPFFYAEAIRNSSTHLRSLYKHVLYYTAPVPTYPSGYWSFFLASEKRLALDSKRAEHIESVCKYYNAQIHEAAFVLPNFFKDLLRTE